MNHLHARLNYMINIFIIWGLILLFILQPGIAHDGAESGARLFVHALLPYLLPYIILTQWLLKTPRTTSNVPIWRRYTKAYVLGSFGGFPVGAVTVSEMLKNDELTHKQSSILLAICHSPGPMFIVGFVGTELFGNIGTGWKLLLAIHIANILFFFISILFLFPKNEKTLPATVKINKAAGMPLLDAIKESTSVILLVATTVIFFSSLGTVLSTVFTSFFTVDMGIINTVSLSIFEMTSGVQSATDHFSNYALFPFLIAAIISMNGLSIHMQVTVIAKTASIPLLPYVFGRLWCIVLVPIIFYLIY